MFSLKQICQSLPDGFTQNGRQSANQHVVMLLGLDFVNFLLQFFIPFFQVLDQLFHSDGVLGFGMRFVLCSRGCVLLCGVHSSQMGSNVFVVSVFSGSNHPAAFAAVLLDESLSGQEVGTTIGALVVAMVVLLLFGE